MVLLAGMVLLVLGLLLALTSVVVLADQALFDSAVSQSGLRADTGVRNAMRVVLAIFALMGVLQMIAAVGIFLRKSWARYVGIALAIMGTLLGVIVLVDTLESGGGAVAVWLLIAAGYAFSLFALIAGASHFSRGYGR